MEGRITWETVSGNSQRLQVQFADEPDTTRMTPEELEFYEFDLLWEVFMDHHAVKDNVIKAMRTAGFDRDLLLATEDVSGMVQSLRCEQNVEINNEVEAEIKEAIEAYKRG